MAFCIITDSASDVPRSVIDKYDLYVMPTPVTIDNEDLRDGVTIFPEEFYKIQEEGIKEIKTYHISQLMFEEHFTKFAKAGDEVLYICFSTGVAGTYQAASLAKETVLKKYPDFKITIIDSRCASIGYGLVTERVLKMQKNGAPKELLIEAAKYFCDHMIHAVAVQTLDYLYAGGRVGRASFVVGGMLDIKPIIMMDENGSLKATEKVRGWKKALNRVVDICEEQGAELSKQTVGLVYGTTVEDANYVEEILRDKLKVDGVLKGQVGCAIGAHTGPGVIGLVFQDAINEKYYEYLR
ncbi:MAG: DegV family protein [Ruminococcaceae bacterium]|nr:DegV family protein [Oscillospiraceae bacterium]